jgi:xylan 1,4-beta-xylosidase
MWLGSLLGLLLSPGLAAATPPPIKATVTVTSSVKAPFPHTWKKTFGSGHAALGLRDDWMASLIEARDTMGLQGIRQHGIFDDDMGVVTGHRQYDWTHVDTLWERLVGAGLVPVVELSFMPAVLANCSWMGPVAGSCHGNQTAPCSNIRPGCDNGSGGLKPGCPKCHGGMAYQGVYEHPIDYDDWYHLVYALVSHAVDKFGESEVQRWSWECWNELWGFGGNSAGGSTPRCSRPPCIGSDYMALYNASAVAVKAVHPSFKVGGPATEHLNTENFLQQAEAMGAAVDFVSTHNYPTGPRGDGSGCPQRVDWDPECFARDVIECAAKTAPKPFYLSEYSVMVGQGFALKGSREAFSAAVAEPGADGRSGEPPMQHDTAGAAAFVLRVVPQLAPKVDLLSYWTFSDVFEEQEIPKTEFFNTETHQPHYGCMTLHGIKKPVWRAFELLHTHAGTHSLSTEVVNTASAFNGSDTKIELVAAAATTNVTTTGTVDSSSSRVFLSHWDASNLENVTMTHPSISTDIVFVLTATDCAALQLTSAGLSSTAWIVDKSSQAVDLWLKMGSPPVPSDSQLAQLKAYSVVKPTKVSWAVTSRGKACHLEATVLLEPNSGGVVELPALPKEI